jgi:hypothetical protein
VSSSYAVAFFVLVEELGVLPEQHAAQGADVRVITAPAREL